MKSVSKLRIAVLLISILICAIAFTVSHAADMAAAPAAPVASGNVVGKPIAIVNNEPIFQDEFERESEPFLERYKKTVPEKDQTPEKLAKLKDEILERLIEEKLLLQEAKNKKIRVMKNEIERGVEQFKEPFQMDEDNKPRSPAQIEKAFQEQLVKEGMTQDQFNHRVEEQLMKVRLIDAEVKSKIELPKDEDVKAFFSKVKSKMGGKAGAVTGNDEDADIAQLAKYLDRMSGEQMRLRHILVRFKPKADPVEKAQSRKKIDGYLARIKGGEDFAFMAKKYSEDPLSRDRGGDLGFVAPGDLGLPEIDRVVTKLHEGEVSPVIETEIGYHLMKLIEKKAPHPVEYDDIKEDLRNFQAQRTYTSKLDKYLKSLRAKAAVKINPAN